jgi:extracellular factor (EF) 3-hydroxypalmitic acid methyl ester biosynthesis protein
MKYVYRKAAWQAICRGELDHTNMMVELNRGLEQLPVLWSRKENICPAFRNFTAEMVFDLQVYRGLFDEIDRNLAEEQPSIRAEVRRVVTESQYGSFQDLFNRKLAELEAQVSGFSHEEHERHGFYLRKHVWDIILASTFLRRTNLKPWGYAGDAVMMRMLYENEFRGNTIFARFVHRHPLQTAAAQAVRNRVILLGERISRAGREWPSSPLRVISIACGPAWELHQLYRSIEDFKRYDITLLDQDPKALAEAQATVAEVEARHGAGMRVHYIQDSVRTLLCAPAQAAKWGRFAVIYSMGLFDYLSTPVAKAVLERLYDLLDPGGQLIIGNYHCRNPTRIYMEYWMDWSLIYRTEEELFDLAYALKASKATILFENTHSQMFLCIHKQPDARR